MQERQIRKAEKKYSFLNQELIEADNMSTIPALKREARKLRKIVKKQRSKLQRRIDRELCQGDF